MQIDITYNNKTKNIISYTNISKKINIFVKKKLKITIENIEIGIHFISQKDIKLLNSKYRNINKPTDVLSFPIYNNLKKHQITSDHQINLGDIFICFDIATNQAVKNNITINQEIEKLAIHGLKHLVGIHHK